MEVLIALAISAISLVPLLHLLVKSISTMDAASCQSNATIIANSVLAETISEEHIETGTKTGTIKNETDNIIYKWQVTIANYQIEELQKLDLHSLRKVNVDVYWNQGQSQKQVSVSSLISSDDSVEKSVSRNDIN